MSTSAPHAALLTPSGQHAIITPQADGSDRPLVRAAAVLAALTAVALTAYLLVIAAHDVPYVVRARLATLTAVLVVLTGATLISLAALRVQRRQRAGDLASLRGHLDRQAAGYRVAVEEGMVRLEAAVVQRVDELGQRVGAVEQQVAERGVAIDVLRGVAAWAMDMDQRLTDVQSTLRKDAGADVPAQSNGHKETSPMELSDEAMRGYFLGFYDRQADAPNADGN